MSSNVRVAAAVAVAAAATTTTTTTTVDCDADVLRWVELGTENQKRENVATAKTANCDGYMTARVCGRSRSVAITTVEQRLS